MVRRTRTIADVTLQGGTYDVTLNIRGETLRARVPVGALTSRPQPNTTTSVTIDWNQTRLLNWVNSPQPSRHSRSHYRHSRSHCRHSRSHCRHSRTHYRHSRSYCRHSRTYCRHSREGGNLNHIVQPDSAPPSNPLLPGPTPLLHHQHPPLFHNDVRLPPRQLIAHPAR